MRNPGPASSVLLLRVISAGLGCLCLLSLGLGCDGRTWRFGPKLLSGGTDRANCLVCHDNNGRGGSTGTHIFAPDRECLDCHLADDFEVVPHSGLRLSSNSCAICHDAPPDSGAHRAHVAPQSAVALGYGSLAVSADIAGDAKQAAYHFGCGHCHPLDQHQHLNGQLEIELFSPIATGLKALSPLAQYQAGAQQLTDARGFDYTEGTCSNVYCHSDGRPEPSLRRYASPAFGKHWEPSERCGACHDSPPRYPSGSANGPDSNAHFVQNAWGEGEPGGHVLAIHWLHPSASPGLDTIMGCEVCHAATVELGFAPSPELPGVGCGDPILNCHDAGANRLPLRGQIVDTRFHVNGQREVRFTTAPIRSSAQPPMGTLAPFSRVGDFDQADLSRSTYDPTTRSCSNVACHLGQDAKWGKAPDEGFACEACHVF